MTTVASLLTLWAALSAVSAAAFSAVAVGARRIEERELARSGRGGAAPVVPLPRGDVPLLA